MKILQSTKFTKIEQENLIKAMMKFHMLIKTSKEKLMK